MIFLKIIEKLIYAIIMQKMDLALDNNPKIFTLYKFSIKFT